MPFAEYRSERLDTRIQRDAVTDLLRSAFSDKNWGTASVEMLRKESSGRRATKFIGLPFVIDKRQGWFMKLGESDAAEVFHLSQPSSLQQLVTVTYGIQADGQRLVANAFVAPKTASYFGDVYQSTTSDTTRYAIRTVASEVVSSCVAIEQAAAGMNPMQIIGHEPSELLAEADNLFDKLRLAQGQGFHFLLPQA